MSPLRFKNVFFTFSAAVFLAVGTYAYNVRPQEYISALGTLDVAFFAAIRFGLVILALVVPFRRFIVRAAFAIASFFAVGFFLPLIHFSDTGDLVYLIYFVITFGVMLIVYLVTHSKFALSPAVTNVFSVLLLLIAVILLSISISWSKTVTQEYTRFYAVDQLRCHADLVTYEQYKNVCSMLTGRFWEKQYGSSYQNDCYSRAKGVAEGDTNPYARKDCGYVSQYESPKRRFTSFLMDYFDTRTWIGLPHNI